MKNSLFKKDDTNQKQLSNPRYLILKNKYCVKNNKILQNDVSKKYTTIKLINHNQI